MRLTRAALVGCLLVVPACVQAAPAAASGAPHVAAHQETVALLASATVRDGPAPDAKVVAQVPAKRPMTGAAHGHAAAGPVHRQHRRIVAQRAATRPRAEGPDAAGDRAGSARRARETSATDWHLVVNRGARSVTVYRNGHKLRRYKAIVGKSSTPTPTGEFFVEENVRLPGGRPGAPFALATSARSKVFQEFEGGPGQIALHGLTNVGGTLGTAVSHGCVRLANRSISWLAARIKPGDPVTIV